ncbi:MFS transporter [Nocardioides luteus]|uniref:MFS transporter n=1 Tax=Nocardioides luteus TaxID=1844 RepID=UPI0018CA8957|nr:MFS transporter [Nocardioides luteus]MBG6099055.1 MHS family proline/betaine transporter-like MFS transporter [Nocardioides luteus]
MTSAPPEIDRRTTRQHSVAAGIGNTIETYEFAVFGFLATLLAGIFFPNSSPTTALLSTFAVFGTAFLFRPIGGVLIGMLADRIGRQPALVLTLISMAIATALIGMLPTVATAGPVATVGLVLLRLCQGLSAGGEYTAAVIYAAESSPEDRAPEMASRVQVGSLAGLLLAAIVVVGLSVSLTPEQMASWGWRVPFLLAIPLGAFGLLLRSRLGETPAFEAARDAGVSPAPSDTFWSNWPGMLGIAGVAVLHAIGFYMTFTFVQATIVQRGFTLVEATSVVGCALLVGIGFVVAGGKLSNRLGPRTVLITASLITLVSSWPLWSLVVGADSLIVVLFASIGLAAGPALYGGAAPITYVRHVSVARRGTVVALAYGITITVLGGTASYVAQWLINTTGDTHSPVWLILTAAAISAFTAWRSTPTATALGHGSETAPSAASAH